MTTRNAASKPKPSKVRKLTRSEYETHLAGARWRAEADGYMKYAKPRRKGKR